MFRFVFFLSLFLTAAMASPALPPVIPVPSVTKVASRDVETATSPASQARARQYLPTVSNPNELHACYCLRQGDDCSAILAASSGLCKANTLRRHQSDPCILRCARYCLYKAKSNPICQGMNDWLVQKVFKLARKSLN